MDHIEEPEVQPARYGRVFVGTLALTVVGVVAGYFWLDRPISYFAHDRLAQYRIFVMLQRVPEYLAVVAMVAFAAAAYLAIARRPAGKCFLLLLMSGTSLAISALIKDQLKFVF